MGMPPRPSFEAMIRACGLTDSLANAVRGEQRNLLARAPARLAMMPGLHELLDVLEKASIPKAIATSSVRRLTEACLAPFDLCGDFASFLPPRTLPTASRIRRLTNRCAAIRWLPPEMLVLEDSQNGCRAAAAAGAFAVAVPGQHSRDHDFGAARLVIESLADPRLYAAMGVEAKA